MRDRILILFLIIFTILSIMFYSFIDTLVIRKGYVKSVNNSLVTIVDNFGEVWKYNFEKGEELHPNQKVKMIMSNNSTERQIKDDIILKIVVDK